MDKFFAVSISILFTFESSYPNEFATQLAELEVSLSSLRQLLPSRPPVGMSFGQYLNILTMKDLNIPDSDDPLIINKNMFDNSKGFYQVRVLEQRGVQCGWHAIKNIFWFMNALTATSEAERKQSLPNLLKQSVYDPFYGLISEAVGGCPRSGMLSTSIIEQVTKYLCTGKTNLEIKSASALNTLKSQNNLSYGAICPHLQSKVVTFFKEGIDPEDPGKNEKITMIENTISSILNRTNLVEGGNWLPIPENSYKKALEIICLFSYEFFFGEIGMLPQRENFKDFYNFQKGEIASLSYMLLLPAGINHFVALAAYKQGDIQEYFLLNSINNGYLESALKNIESLSSLLNLSLVEFKKLLLRFFIEQYNFDLSYEVLEKAAPTAPLDIEDIEAGKIAIPTKIEMFSFALGRAGDLLTAIDIYDLNNLELYNIVYKQFIIRNLEKLRDRINRDDEISQDQKQALFNRIQQYITAFEEEEPEIEIEIEEDEPDIEILD